MPVRVWLPGPHYENRMIYDKDYIRSRCIEDPETGCWNWTKSTSDGYGHFVIAKEKKSYRAHRFMYEQVNGTVPPGLVIRHLCLNKLCCNPKHLAAGTHKENNDDSRHLYEAAAKKKSKVWIVNGITYGSQRQATKATGLGSSSLIRYTDAVTREFDVATYRTNCIKQGRTPKV